MNRQEELASLIDRYATEDGVNPTEIPRLSLLRTSRPTEPLHALYTPELCIFAQGKKEVFLGEEVYLCDQDQHLIASVDLPVIGQILEAEPGKPYLALQLDLDVAMLGELLVEAGMEAPINQGSGTGLMLIPTPLSCSTRPSDCCGCSHRRET